MKTTTRKKLLNDAIISIRKDDDTLGGSIMGLLGERTEMKNDDGSMKLGNFGQPLWTFEMIDLHSGEVKKVWGDGGLAGAFKMSRVKPGQAIEIVHTGQKKLEQGTVQTYEIYEVEVK